MIRRISIFFGAIIALLVIAGAAAYIYLVITGGSPEASEEITENVEQLDSATDSQTVFRIIQEESRVRFTLEEDLAGVRTTVIGETNQVAGDILIDRATPSNSQIGAIRINLRTLETDRSSRDRMMRSQILQSAKDEFEFTEFEPTHMTGLPESVSVGEAFSFQVTGNLPLAGVTKEVTFEVTVTPVSEERIEGSGTTTVLRSDYGLQIPNVQQVANVTDEVRLEIAFVAVVVQDAEINTDASAG